MWKLTYTEREVILTGEIDRDRQMDEKNNRVNKWRVGERHKHVQGWIGRATDMTMRDKIHEVPSCEQTLGRRCRKDVTNARHYSGVCMYIQK